MGPIDGIGGVSPLRPMPGAQTSAPESAEKNTESTAAEQTSQPEAQQQAQESMAALKAFLNTEGTGHLNLDALGTALKQEGLL